MALDEDVVTDDQLYLIAHAAAGDARPAIGILRTAAGKADRSWSSGVRLTTPQRLQDSRAQLRLIINQPETNSARGPSPAAQYTRC